MAEARRRRSVAELLANLPSQADPTSDAIGMDYGLGPVTPTSRAGQTPESAPTGELRNIGSYDRINPLSERIGTAALDYGAAPAQAFVDQAGKAGTSTGEFVDDPTLPNFGKAAMDNALAAAPVSLKAAAVPAAGVVGGLIEAGRRTFAPDILPTSEAQQQQKKAPPPQIMNGRSWQDLLALAGGDESLARTWAAMGSKALGDALKDHASNSPNAIRARGEAEAAASAAKAKQQTDEAAVKRAGMAYDDIMATDKTFADTPYAKYTEALGGTDPYVYGGVAGLLARMAGEKRLGPIMAGGAAFGFGAGNVGLLYDANKTPTLNPKREALLAYDRELPLDHPEKGKRAQYVQDNAEAFPTQNPVRTQAQELMDYTQPSNIIRGGINALEGALTAPAGAHVVDATKNAAYWLANQGARLPGTAYRNFVDGFTRTPEPPPPNNPPPFDNYSYRVDTPAARNVLERAYRSGGPADVLAVRDGVLSAAERGGRNLNPSVVERRTKNATRAIEGSGYDLTDPAQRTLAINENTKKGLQGKKGRAAQTLGIVGGGALGADALDGMLYPDDASSVARMLAERGY